MNPNASSGSNVIFQLRNLLQSSQSVLIALPERADEDTTAAALALYLVLTKMRKQTTVLSASEVKVERAYLFGIDKITNQISGGNTLVVSLPYAEGSIEKVSYNIENNRFNLVIEPRGEALTFDPNQIEYNYGKGEYDIVFVLGASSLSDLGPVAEKHANAFTGKPIVNIDKSQNNTGFGRINLVNNAPISQTMTTLLKSLRMPIDPDPASNLYTGITSAQQGVTLSSASPDALEAIAFLLRSKAQLLTQSGTSQPSQKQPASQKQSGKKKKFKQIQESVAPQGQPTSESFSVPQQNVQSQPQGSAPTQPVQPQPEAGRPLDEAQPVQQQDVAPVEEAPEDWLKPKIFTTHNNSSRAN